MRNPQPPKVIVIGGSDAGLSTGIALRCLGCRVDVYEQSPTILRGRGGGLVVQYEMLDWMTTHGIAALATLSIPGVERQFLDRQGQVIQRFADSTPSPRGTRCFISCAQRFPMSLTTTAMSASASPPTRRARWWSLRAVCLS